MLVAEHRTDDLELLGGMLEGAGHEFFAAADGDEALRRVRTDYPEVVVLGGGVMGAGELLLGPAREEMLARALPPGRDFVRVVTARFGAEAGMVGAASLALDGLDARGGAAA